MLSPARVADGRLSRLESNALHARQSAGAADHRLLTFRRYTGCGAIRRIGDTPVIAPCFPTWD